MLYAMCPVFWTPSHQLIGRLFRKTPRAGFTNPSRREVQEFLGGFELDTSLLVFGWEAFVFEAEVR